MKPEARLRQRVVKALSSLHAFPVENVIRPGTPDVNCTLCWLELKIDEVLKSGVVALSHLRNEQKVFLYKYWEAGGKAFLLLEVGTAWFLVPGNRCHLLGRPSLDELKFYSVKHWDVRPSDEEFLKCILQICQPEKSGSSLADEQTALSRRRLPLEEFQPTPTVVGRTTPLVLPNPSPPSEKSSEPRCA